MITQPSYQLKFDLDLPEEEPAGDLPLTPEEIQARKDTARAMLGDERHWPKDADGKPIKPFWYEHFLKLEGGRWPFRVAALIAWLATPKKYRWPKTQAELADLLGMASDRQFSVWRAKNPQIDAAVNEVWKERAMDRLNDSMEAMFEVASQPDYKGRGDRELHFKIAGILSDAIELSTKGDTPDLSKLTFAEKLKIAGLDDPEALLALKKKIMDEKQGKPEGSEGEGA